MADIEHLLLSYSSVCRGKESVSYMWSQMSVFGRWRMNKVPTDLWLNQAHMYTAKCKPTMIQEVVLTSWVLGFEGVFLVSRFKRGGVEK